MKILNVNILRNTFCWLLEPSFCPNVARRISRTPSAMAGLLSHPLTMTASQLHTSSGGETKDRIIHRTADQWHHENLLFCTRASLNNVHLANWRYTPTCSTPCTVKRYSFYSNTLLISVRDWIIQKCLFNICIMYYTNI